MNDALALVIAAAIVMTVQWLIWEYRTHQDIKEYRRQQEAWEKANLYEKDGKVYKRRTPLDPETGKKE